MFCGKYQVVNRACADCVDEVNEELDHEDGDKERRHDAACCVPGCRHRALGQWKKDSCRFELLHPTLARVGVAVPMTQGCGIKL
jgi:hypothetical protein